MDYLLYFFIINCFTFFMYANDKHQACYGKMRWPEIVLIIFALIGGAFGALMAMLLFRHKTEKPLFKIAVPIFLIIHCVILFIMGYPADILPDINF